MTGTTESDANLSPEPPGSSPPASGHAPAELPAAATAEWSPEQEARLNEHIAAEVERRFQSAKDRRWAQLEKQYGALHEFQQALESAQPGGQPRQADWMADKARRLLESAGLDNDPELTALLSEKDYAPGPDGYVDLLSDLTELVLRRSQRAPASAATVAQPAGGAAPPPDLRQEYQQQLARLAPGDIQALTALKRQFRAKGLDVF